MEQQDRLFFDISSLRIHLGKSARFSGIQRVVVMLITRCAARLGPANVWISFWDKKKGAYLALPLASLPVDALVDADRLRTLLGLKGRRGQPVDALWRYADRPVKHAFHSFRYDVLAFLGIDRSFNRLNLTAAAWRDLRRPVRGSHPLPQTARFLDIATPADKLVLLDSSWTVPKAQLVFVECRSLGVRVSMMVHDLIPITSPALVPGDAVAMFHDSLRESAAYISVYLANSEATRRDLELFLASYNTDLPIHTIPLAQERLPAPGNQIRVAGSDDLAERYREAMRDIGIRDQVRSIASAPFVLCVGTIEPRKNIWRLFLTWDRLRHLRGTQVPRLIFAGKTGWMSGNFQHALRATGNLSGWLEIVEAPSDRELSYLYRHCLFLVQPSLHEGWGLPVGEALSYGKTAVVSDTTSLPEVGGDMVEYCDPLSVDSIEAACLSLIAHPGRLAELEARIAATRLRTWDDVARDLIAALQLQSTDWQAQRLPQD